MDGIYMDNIDTYWIIEALSKYVIAFSQNWESI